MCSESGYSLEAIISELADIPGVKVTTRVNPDFIRLNDNAIIIGSHAKIKRKLDGNQELACVKVLSIF